MNRAFHVHVGLGVRAGAHALSGRRWSCAAAAAVVLFGAPHARGEPPSAAAASSTTNAFVETLEPSDVRDPFWAVGWTPPVPEAVAPKSVQPNAVSAPASLWDEAIKKLRVTGLSRGPDGEYVAIIRDIGLVEKGDIVAVGHGGLVYRWRILAITKDGIQPERVGVFPKTNEARGEVKAGARTSAGGAAGVEQEGANP